MFIGKSELEKALKQLAERLRFAGAPHTAILVGGGAALNVLGLISKTTKDVDIIAIASGADRDLRFERAEPLPGYLEQAIKQTADDLSMPEEWMNAGPTSLVDFGLPKGCIERALRVDYGERLTVYFVSRLDQIHFKLFAAVDHGGGRHLADLTALRPTPEELLAAGQWSMTHDPSEGYRQSLLSLLREMGHPDVANKL